jgi:hypothetical protein
MLIQDALLATPGSAEKHPSGKKESIKLNPHVAFEPLIQARMKPPPQSADPRSLVGVPLIMR